MSREEGRGKRPRGLRELDEIDAVFAALSHQTRRHILQVLAARDGEMTAGDLSARFAHSWPTTTRHLGLLLEAGLVTVEAVGRERRYRIARQRLGDVLALWLGSVGFGVHSLKNGRTAEEDPMSRMSRLESIVSKLPEAERVDIEEWGDHPSFRVRGKNFVFCDAAAEHLSLKLSREEAEAMVATDSAAEPTGYGLRRHGWVSLTVEPDASDERWQQIAQWVRTSYTLVAPRSLARLVLADDGLQ